MTVPLAVLAVLCVALGAGMAWMFANGGALHKATAVGVTGVVGFYLLNPPAAGTPVTAGHGLGIVAMIGGCLVVWHVAKNMWQWFVIAGLVLMGANVAGLVG